MSEHQLIKYCPSCQCPQTFTVSGSETKGSCNICGWTFGKKTIPYSSKAWGLGVLIITGGE